MKQKGIVTTQAGKIPTGCTGCAGCFWRLYPVNPVYPVKPVEQLQGITRFCAGLILVLAAVMLAGCKSSQPTPAVVSSSLGNTYTSQALDTSYPGALNAASQLMLGTLRLEGAENAVTPEQAKTLLLLWQALSGRVLQSDAERNAVLAYIETQMTPAQLQAIAAMRLTQNDLLARISEGGQEAGFGAGRTGAGQRGALGTPPAGGGAMPPEMVTRQAQFGRGTPQARGTSRETTGGVGAGSGQDAVLLNSLIRLLTQRAEGAAPSQTTRTPARTPAPRSLPTPSPIPTSLPSPTPTKP